MSENISDLLSNPMHSKDLVLHGIDQAGIEESLGIKGYLQHLKDIGWDSYQWRYYPDDFTIFSKTENKNIRPIQFVEVFGSRYKGYIRGNSRTSLMEACKSAVQQAQRFAQCEAKTEHDYKPYQGYTNGLMACTNCGFNGYNTLTGMDRSNIRNLETHLKVERTMRNEIMIGMKEWGITLHFDGRFLVDQSVYNAKLVEFEGTES